MAHVWHIGGQIHSVKSWAAKVTDAGKRHKLSYNKLGRASDELYASP